MLWRLEMSASVGYVSSRAGAQTDLPCVSRLQIAARRLPEIDIARALAMTLMISGHSIGLAEVGAASFFRSAAWLPRGWSVPCFLFLTGMTAALAYDADRRRWADGALKKIAQLAAVMFASNLIFLASKYALTGELARLRDPGVWPWLFAFRVDSTISAILLPSILVLAVIKWLCVARDRLSEVAFGCLAAMFFVGTWVLYVSHQAVLEEGSVMRMMFTPLGGFPVLPLMSNGVLGVALSRVIQRRACSHSRYPRPIVFLALASLMVLLSSLSRAAVVQVTVGSILRLGIVFVIASAIHWYAPGRFVRQLSRLGRFGLFVFILHRPIVQAVLLATSSLAPVPAARYAVLFSITMAAVSLLCAARLRYAAFDRAWRITCL